MSIEAEDEIHVQEAFALDSLARLLTNYFEAYFIFLHAAERILGSGECEEKELFNQVLRRADSLYRKGEVSCRESRSSFLFRNALDSMISQGCIRRTRTKGGVVLQFEEAGREKFGVYKRTVTQLLFPGESN